MTAADPTTTAGAGGDPASAGAATEPSAPPEADYKQRAIDNPVWGAEQMVQHQSRGDRAEADNKKLVEQIEPVKNLLDTYGAQTVAAAVENYRAVRNSTEIGEMIQEFERTGQLPTRTGSEPKAEEDEYKTPEELEIVALRSELAMLRNETNANTLASGRTVLQGHMEKVFSEYGFTQEDTDKMKTTITQQFEAWGTQGDPGKAAMKSLTSAGGEATVRGIMLSSITPEALRAAAANTDLRKRQGLERLATDGPSGISSTGREAPAQFDSHVAAAKYARENPDGHDSY